MVINAFKNKIFPKKYPYDYSEYESPQIDSGKDDSEKDDSGKYDKFYKEISSIDNRVNHELIKKYFKKRLY